MKPKYTRDEMETDIYERTSGKPLPSNVTVEEDIEHISNNIATQVTEVLLDTARELLESNTISFVNGREVNFSLPFEWSSLGSDGHGNPPVENPLAIDFSLYYSDYDNALTWRGNFQALIDDVIVGHLHGEVVAKDTAQKVFVPMRDELLKLVDKFNYFIDRAEEIKGEEE